VRWSETFIPTLRNDPVEAAAASHRLMLRAGMIRQVGAGSYAYLPLGLRALNKVVGIVRQEMDRAGALEVLLPALWPAELLEKTGRLEAFGQDLISFLDRHGRPHVLAPTHEELATSIVRDDVRSYRQLPLLFYQVQTKFRDEPRPRSGVLRTREFIMKDAYSFSADDAGLDECYARMCGAYRSIFERCGLTFVAVEAGPGAMGGEVSHEFMVPAQAGEDAFVQCSAPGAGYATQEGAAGTGCGYAANVEHAAIQPPPEPPPLGYVPQLREVHTPGQTTIQHVSRFLNVRPEQMIKTIIYVTEGRPVAALVRGDHDVNEAKLRRELGTTSLALADPATIERVSGAPVGFSGPVGLKEVEVLVDHAAMRVQDGVVGANKADAHLTGVVPGRDFPLARVADIRCVTSHDRCCRCGGPICFLNGIEVGHVFKLGTRYSDALGATYLDSDGKRKPFVMGSYGIGVNRILAALVESVADAQGIAWPPSIAPYEALVMPLDMSQKAVVAAAETAHDALENAGLEALLDDRDERPGVKFHDAELIGLPVRIVVGRGYLTSGNLELQVRQDGSRKEVPAAHVVEAVREVLASLCSHPPIAQQPPVR